MRNDYGTETILQFYISDELQKEKKNLTVYIDPFINSKLDKVHSWSK